MADKSGKASLVVRVGARKAASPSSTENTSSASARAAVPAADGTAQRVESSSQSDEKTIASANNVEDLNNKTSILLGAPAKQHIRTSLRCKKPIEKIKQFQRENALHGCFSILPLLDLQAIPHLELHNNVLQFLKTKMMARIPAMTPKQLDQLTIASFPYIQIPELRDVAKSALKHHDHIPADVLVPLSKDETLLEECDDSVKRQVWAFDTSIFTAKIMPLCEEYVSRAREKWRQSNELFHNTPGSYRSDFDHAVEAIAAMIDKNVKLYDATLMVLRTRFVETGNIHYCSLRVDVSMAVQARGMTALYAQDASYQFLLSVHMTCKDDKFDNSRMKELTDMLDSAGDGPISGEYGFILNDPFHLSTFVRLAWNELEAAVKAHELPSKHQPLAAITRCLGTTYQVRHILRNQEFRFPGLSTDMAHTAYPLLAQMYVDDQMWDIRNEEAQYADPSSSEGTLGLKVMHRSFKDDLAHLFESVAYARQIAMHYAHQRIEDKGDVVRLLQLAPHILVEDEYMDMTLCFLRATITSLLTTAWERFSKDDTPLNVIEKVFAPLSKTNIIVHELALDMLQHLPSPINAKVLEGCVRHLNKHGTVSGDEKIASALNKVYRTKFRHLL